MNNEYFTIQQASEGVWGAISVPGSGSLGNAAIIDLGDLTVVVDTTNLPNSAALLRHTAEQLTNKPVKYVVNTHFHGDHVNGNQEFMNSELISTVWTRDLLADMGEVNIDAMQQNIRKLITSLQHERSQPRDPHMLTEIDYDLSVQHALYDTIPSLRRVVPTITFDDKLVIRGTKRTIEVLSYGGGHSLSDAVVYVPEERTLIAGDLVSAKTIPVIPYGNPYAWIRILKRMQQDLKIDTVVPGHGDISNSDRITDVIRFLEKMIAYVAGAVKSGQSESYWLEQGVLKGYEDWHLPQYFRWNFRWLFNSMLVQNNR
ncbi:MBL fold metallo-hydrolase [Paenibacillus sp. FSL R7-0179]|uniref:MBL fold metallo-hydrolase n=1 Tax=Paenibacillus sp. FSL R7-0179 TaxID=2921672 RepID=UPI0030F65887